MVGSFCLKTLVNISFGPVLSRAKAAVIGRLRGNHRHGGMGHVTIWEDKMDSVQVNAVDAVWTFCCSTKLTIQLLELSWVAITPEGWYLFSGIRVGGN